MGLDILISQLCLIQLAVKSVLLKIVARNPMALKDPEPLIGVSSHNESSIGIDVKVWVKNENYFPLFYAMQEEVKNQFDENGITIPYNQICVHNVTSPE